MKVATTDTWMTIDPDRIQVTLSVEMECDVDEWADWFPDGVPNVVNADVILAARFDRTVREFRLEPDEITIVVAEFPPPPEGVVPGHPTLGDTPVYVPAHPTTTVARWRR